MFKTGDKVIYRNRYHYKVVTISKITPTGIIKVAEILGSSFTPEGHEKGSGTYGTLSVITQVDRDYFTHQKLLRDIENIDFQELPIVKLQHILKVLNTKSGEQTDDN